MDFTGVKYDELKVDLIGVNSLYGNSIEKKLCDPALLGEVRLRVAGRTVKREDAVKIGK